MLGTVLVMIMIIKVIIVDCHDYFHIHIDPCEVSMLRTESGHDCDNQVIIVVMIFISIYTLIHDHDSLHMKKVC